MLQIFGDRENTFFTSFKKEVALKIRELNKNVSVGIITRKFDDSVLKFLVEYELDVVSIKYIAVKKEWIDKCHENGLKVVTLTLDNPSIAKNFIEWGIDGIITNKPNLLINSLKKNE